MRQLLLLVFLFAAAGLHGASIESWGIVLAGERVRFDDGLPRFSNAQIERTTPATRKGLEKWARTAEGRDLIRKFDAPEYRITVREDGAEKGAGRAPQPGLLMFLVSSDSERQKIYELVLNPAFEPRFKPEPPVDGEYRTAVVALRRDAPNDSADVMAAAWAAEMLHIDFYSRGIVLPHHSRSDFRRRWERAATELGFPDLRHDDDEQ